MRLGNVEIRILTPVALRVDVGSKGDDDPATTAQLFSPRAIALDAAGNLFIADSGNSKIRRVDAVTGIITSVNKDALDTTAIAIDADGNLYVTDRGAALVRKLGPDGTQLGTVGELLHSPFALKHDRQGNLLI